VPIRRLGKRLRYDMGKMRTGKQRSAAIYPTGEMPSPDGAGETRSLGRPADLPPRACEPCEATSC
jgi:hypothetical protein